MFLFCELLSSGFILFTEKSMLLGGSFDQGAPGQFHRFRDVLGTWESLCARPGGYGCLLPLGRAGLKSQRRL